MTVFGRLPRFDERSRAFGIRTLMDVTPGMPRRSFTWRVNTWLDQGSEGACVGYAFAHELISRPVTVAGITGDTARKIYWDAQAVDPWPGGAYAGAEPQYEGTSVLSGAQVLKTLGYYKEYRWAFNEEELSLAVGYHGPVVIGVNWYTGMMKPDLLGYLRPTGIVEGGHAILVHAYSRGGRYSLRRPEDGFYTVWNSWGPGWGQVGRARISTEDMARLLHEDGEVCVPVRDKVRRYQPMM